MDQKTIGKPLEGLSEDRAKKADELWKQRSPHYAEYVVNVIADLRRTFERTAGLAPEQHAGFAYRPQACFFAEDPARFDVLCLATDGEDYITSSAIERNHPLAFAPEGEGGSGD